LPRNTWILNQHVTPMFRYSQAQLARMTIELEKRSTALSRLSPWPDINYMIDESWARFYPYAQVVKQAELVELSVRITNHAPNEMTYRVNWNVPVGWQLKEGENSVSIPAREDGEVKARFRATGPGLQVVTADLSFGSWQLPAWTEALIRIQPSSE
jgi:hypothetical protein